MVVVCVLTTNTHQCFFSAEAKHEPRLPRPELHETHRRPIREWRPGSRLRPAFPHLPTHARTHRHTRAEAHRSNSRVSERSSVAAVRGSSPSSSSLPVSSDKCPLDALDGLLVPLDRPFPKYSEPLSIIPGILACVRLFGASMSVRMKRPPLFAAPPEYGAVTRLSACSRASRRNGATRMTAASRRRLKEAVFTLMEAFHTEAAGTNPHGGRTCTVR